MNWETLFEVTMAFVVVLVGIHTYFPFGDKARHLSNFDSLCHAGLPLLVGIACAYWRSQPK